MQITSVLKVVGGITLALALLAVVVGGFGLTAYKQYQLSNTTLQENLSGTVTDITSAANIHQSIQSLQFSEEMLAQSARNYAATSETHWKTQYDQSRHAFDATLADVRAGRDQAPSAELDRVINSANRLAVISAGAIQLAENNQAADAIEALSGSQYTTERTVLASSINDYSAVYSAQVSNALASYQSGVTQAAAAMKEIVITSIVLTGFTLLTGLVLVGIVMQLRTKSWRQFAEAFQAAASEGFSKPMPPSPNPIIRPLTTHINDLSNKAVTATAQSEATIKASHEALLVVDDTGTIRSANTAALDIMEVPKEKLVGKSVDELQALLHSDS